MLITGATSGIGFQLALDYAEQGHSVYACGRNKQVLAASKHKNIIPLIFDITNDQETEQVINNLGIRFDLVILNAGTCEYIDDGRVDLALFRRVFEVNVFGLLNCLAAVQDKLSSGAQLVLMSSTASYVGFPRAEAYGASKSAITYLAKCLAVDLAPKDIHVSFVSPGFVETPLTAKNDFPMPSLISVVRASEYIRQGIHKRKREIHFPKGFSYFLKCIAMLPLSWQYGLLKRMIRKS